jgi:YVTN family beta-propeller protein
MGQGLFLRRYAGAPAAVPATIAALAVLTSVLLAGCGSSGARRPASPAAPVSSRAAAPARTTRTGAAAASSSSASVPRAGRVPPLLSRHDVYAADHHGHLSPAVAGDPARVYVPDTKSDNVEVIDQRTFKVIRTIPVGHLPQHVTPSWDLKTLWVSNDEGNSLTAISPRTSRPLRTVPVRDPYNLYFTPDGRRAIVVAEALHRLDFRDPHTMALRKSVPVTCKGADHMDYTADGRRALVSCEFSGQMILVDLRAEKVLRYLTLSPTAMPQDVKLAPDGRRFFVADMATGGVWVIGARTLHKRFEATGRGAHGIYISRDSRELYVSNRGEGSISVLNADSGRRLHKWRLPGGGSPDMGGVSASGRILWLSGRYNAVVYAISTHDGRLLHRIPVGQGPHGMAVWPQPGRYSIGHTGIMR